MGSLIMDTRNPSTWLNIELHPAFADGTFNPLWYDGNVDEDLSLLRRTCERILTIGNVYGCELHVLDDCTFYAEIRKNNEKLIEIFPSATRDGQRCLFIKIEQFPNREVRVLSAETAKEMLETLEAGKPISQYERIE